MISSASCADLTCSFDASGSQDDSGIDIYHWDFGDGQTGSGVSVSHGYAVAGSYTVTLTVTDTEGLVDSATTIVGPTDPAGPIGMTTAVPGFEHDGRWATTQFFVMDVSFAFVPGAEVSGEWTYLDRRGRVRTKGVTAVSDDNGLVTIRTRFRHTSPTQFCVLDITKPGFVYVESTPCGGPL